MQNMNERQRVVLLTGDGKGKTSSALGMALRAAGHGMRVFFLQFMKARSDVGEVAALRRFPEVEFVQCGRGFVPPPSSPAFAAHRDAARDGLSLSRQKIASGDYRMVVLDEICGAISLGLLDESEVLGVLRSATRPEGLVNPPCPATRPEGGSASPHEATSSQAAPLCPALHPEGGSASPLEATPSRGRVLVLTGRGATPALVAFADTVSRVDCVKHGYDAGWPAMEGVEL